MERRLVEGQDFVIRRLDMQTAKIDGCCVSDADGVSTIIINTRVCQKRQEKAFEHELKHLENDDFYYNESVFAVEARIN